RGSFNALAGQVRRFGRDPLDGHLYVFLNRRRTLVKILAFDRSGFCILCKRLSRGSFQLPPVQPGARQVRIDPAELAMLLEGVDLSAPRRKRYRRPEAPES
ncbi:IS66 family insertion sequence element accessory protein TnpB, partial [Arthrospira platensis SPKY1]|nr:IS66 family insertion sequence element accessory protein TnpB [Arthrospira platensis SPKY1]